MVPGMVFAQSYGPKNPTTGANVTGIGANAWTNAGNILSSNDVDATVATRGTTNYLQGTGFGFNLLNTDVVAGIRLDVEKSGNNVQDVALLGSWSTGTTRSLPSGTNRCLVVIIGLENATVRDITSITYGGRSLSPITDIGLATPFYARTEAWYLLESDLALASGTTISFTYAASAPEENFEIISAAVFANVDQFAPFNDTKTSSTSSTSSTYQIASPINTLDGSMTVTGIFCGNPPDPTQSLGNSTAFTINSGFTETVDYHAANPGFTSSGGVLEVAQKASTAVGTVQPTFTFSGTPNRRTVVGFSIRRARQMDNSVRLKKSSGLVGTDKAQTGVEWPETDTYVSYGSLSDLWGASWTIAEINNSGFGADLSAIVQNGSATVDHMRMTVFTSSVLPLELVSFDAYQKNQTMQCSWLTDSERDTYVFIVERSADAVNFEGIGIVQAAGNSITPIVYGYTDEHPIDGINYYRLKTVDTDGGYQYSAIISSEFKQEQAVSVYPNPASDWATVLTANGFDEIVITDAQGHTVDRIAGTSLQTQQELNLYNLPDGMYFVCIKSGDGKVSIQKLMKTSKTL